MRGLRDRDFLEDSDGDLFCVVGNVHPPGKAISYLKYVKGVAERAARVKWSRGGQVYARILPNYSAVGYLEAQAFLRSRKPHYVTYDQFLGIELTAVPMESVVKHYKPEERLEELSSSSSLDDLERLALELVLLIADESGVSLSNFGVSGSLLLKLHNTAFSDIDLVVYGKENSVKVKEAVTQLLDACDKGLSRPEGEALRRWAEDVSKIHPLSLEEAMRLYGSKWNRALFKGRQFSIHPVKLESEVAETYGDLICKPAGWAKVRCKIIDDSDALYLPCEYDVGSVVVLDTNSKAELKVRKLVSHEGLYSGIASKGEEVIAYGKLEEVCDRRAGEKYHVVHVGSYEMRGLDFIKPLSWAR